MSEEMVYDYLCREIVREPAGEKPLPKSFFCSICNPLGHLYDLTDTYTVRIYLCSECKTLTHRLCKKCHQYVNIYDFPVFQHAHQPVYFFSTHCDNCSKFKHST